MKRYDALSLSQSVKKSVVAIVTAAVADFYECGPFFIAMRPHEKLNDLDCNYTKICTLLTVTSNSNIQPWIMRIMEIQQIITLSV